MRFKILNKEFNHYDILLGFIVIIFIYAARSLKIGSTLGEVQDINNLYLICISLFALITISNSNLKNLTDKLELVSK